MELALKAGSPHRQHGAAAVEFALVFPLLLALVYSTIVYSYVYVLQQSINFASQQGAQAALAVIPTGDAAATAAARNEAAKAAALNTLSWLPAGQLAKIAVPSGGPNCRAGGEFAVEVDFTGPAIGSGGLFPSLVNLPMGLGTVPPNLGTLIACAVAVN
jgi:Flp pilus assembly protein TadG